MLDIGGFFDWFLDPTAVPVLGPIVQAHIWWAQLKGFIVGGIVGAVLMWMARK